MEFYQLKVSHIEHLTADSVRVDFHPSQDGSEDYNYKSGQYLVFEHEIYGETIRRSYSLCSSPEENTISIGIKVVPGGIFSTYAKNDLQVDDVVMASLPQGNFVNKMETEADTHFVFFAAGSGITPILSMIKSTLSLSPDSQVTLFYGNKNVRSIMFLEELEALKNLFVERLQVFHLLSRQPQESETFNGRIDRNKLGLWIPTCFDTAKVDQYFLCGPEEMIMDVRDGLFALGIKRDQVHFELFTTSEGKKARNERQEKQNETVPNKTMEIVLDGKTMLMDFRKDDDNILDKALLQGADLPFACKGGVCCTCKAKLVSGEAKMYVNYGLEHDEIERGYILTCQSYPSSDHVVVSFDAV